jgi:hypothetical protein
MTRQRRGQKVRPERDQAADCERARELLARLTELLYRIGHPRAEEVAGLIEAFDTNAPAAWRALDGNAWWAGAGSPGGGVHGGAGTAAVIRTRLGHAGIPSAAH